jgi:xanthine/CO dehydrogenase XdhC/CoxF family maturation factor
MPVLRLDTSLEALLERLAASAAPAAVATLVSTAGSTYRKAGARMLIEDGGRLTGLLSGGCLEHDLVEHGRAVIASGTPRIVEYDLRSDDDLVFGIGAGCEGAMRILIEPALPGTPLARDLARVGQALAAGGHGALAIVHRGDGELGTRAWHEGCDWPAPLAAAGRDAANGGTSHAVTWQNDAGEHEAWVQALAPVPHVLVCGAGPDAEPLVSLLATLRLRVTVTDHRPAYVEAARFPGATVLHGTAASIGERLALAGCFAAVVMSHHLASDEAYLRALAASPIAHVGLLGPRPRREKLLAALGPAAQALRPRLRGPVGLDLGAVTPEGIALAIAAELHALAAGRPGGPGLGAT